MNTAAFSIVKVSFLILLIAGCATQTVHLKNTKLAAINMERTSAIAPGNYLIFQFEADPILSEIDDTEDLWQTKVRFYKAGKLTDEKLESGPYGWNVSDKTIAPFEQSNSFASFLFKNNQVYSVETGNATGILDLDFDHITINIRSVNMPGIEAKSNPVKFTKNELETIIHASKPDH